MAYSVTKLITESYFISGIVARQFEELQGYQLNDGLDWLNDILGDRAMGIGNVAYIQQQYPFTGVVGQETYFIPNCINIDTLVFYIGSVRYQMQFVDRNKYFGQPRANNINALPVSYTYERVFGGVMVWVYFWPQQPFLFNITGDFFMNSVALNQDLTAQTSTANLGTPFVYGAGTLNAGGLVINGVDMAGTYATIGALVTHINSVLGAAFINVSASVTTGQNAQFMLTGIFGANITVASNGTQTNGNNINFSYFNTTGGIPLSQTYNAMALDLFYINYLKFELAERDCQELNFSMPEEAAKKLASYRQSVTKMSEPLDLTAQIMSCLGDSRAINYAQANIGRGYTVSGF